MKTVLAALGVVLGIGLAYVVTHMALIEVGQEIVVHDKPTQGGDPSPARLWIVESKGGT
jgi:hypothetical protein